jgi:hypothetical protein
MLENSFLIDTQMQKLDTIVPATVLVGYLSKAQFCTGSGQPISKPIWTDLSDWDILDQSTLLVLVIDMISWSKD